MGKARAVTINSHKSPNGKISFDMDDGGNKTDTLVFDKTKDNMKKAEHYDLQFTLVNNDGLKLEFLQDTNNVMWVAKGTKAAPPGCPTSHASDPEFTVTGVTATVLDVTNTDMDVCKFKFVLNFVDTEHNNKAEQYDPIYDNQNGGSPKLSAAGLIIGTLVVIGGLAVLVAVTS